MSAYVSFTIVAMANVLLLEFIAVNRGDVIRRCRAKGGDEVALCPGLRHAVA